MRMHGFGDHAGQKVICRTREPVNHLARDVAFSLRDHCL